MKANPKTPNKNIYRKELTLYGTKELKSPYLDKEKEKKPIHFGPKGVFIQFHFSFE